ncbi:hypothetical protein [Wolbachia endosymbiont of Ctenocephalides felis wCfeJ]|uniref:hypothetical protein n=1 Tax=Wolbachia endosymbiont of Ctenocephalides felis wCfeJ TaxID=2732594 RepID=UPI001445E000|nr:hypothetical protein [Wolbachia endosymbiont of Ctenocephalides felis wCfeJ]WCR58345.1 MAG: Chromosome partition protein Smc [Wolbachia endosymbiont of Ctenocephalides felis wCfeJ]
MLNGTLKGTLSLVSDNQIKIHTNDPKLEEYTIPSSDQKSNYTYCMLDNTLLRIYIGSNQENIAYQVVTSVSTLNGDNNWEKATEVEEVKKLLGLSETTNKREIEIFKHFGPVLQKLARQLETAKQQAEDKQQELQVKLQEQNNKIQELNTQTEELKKQLKAKDTEIAELIQQLLNADVTKLQADLEAKNQEIAQLQQQPSNAKVQELEKKLAAKNTEVQQLQKKNKELEAKKQSTEQSKAPVYTATVGVGLAAGLLLAAVLGHTTKLPMLAIVGVAAASVLVAGGIT